MEISIKLKSQVFVKLTCWLINKLKMDLKFTLLLLSCYHELNHTRKTNFTDDFALLDHILSLTNTKTVNKNRGLWIKSK
jgi:hypothetical protein